MKKIRFTLTQKILDDSKSKIWDQAVKEWENIDVYETDDPETCLCGHFPIKEVCVIKNKETGVVHNVGNCCVKKFLGLRPDMVLKSVKKITKDITSSVNVQALEFFYNKNYIDCKDYSFYFDTWRKRVLSPAQMKWRVDINNRILKKFNLKNN
jgi:hypothetical protein